MKEYKYMAPLRGIDGAGHLKNDRVMKSPEKTVIIVEATIHSPVEEVWKLWTEPNHILHWNYASDDWQTTRAENDLKEGGRFLTRMEAKDGSTGFDFSGQYSKVEQYKQIEYTLDDGRNVQVLFIPGINVTTITEAFEAEHTNSVKMQTEGWQAILNNFKRYVESVDRKEILHFEIIINADVKKVFKNMLDDKKYSEWTSVFNPTSHFEGSWKKGSKILFLGTDQDGSMGGMVSKIKEYLPERFVSIEHLGVIENGREIMSGSKVEKWAGGLENYSFTGKNGKTMVEIDIDVAREWKAYFDNTWPKALDKLKEICEK